MMKLNRRTRSVNSLQAGLVFVFLLLPFLPGCIVIPTGSDIDAERVSRIEPGITTRGEVEEILGKPNVLNEPRFAVYRLQENTGLLIVLIAKNPLPLAEESYNLVFAYDTEGRVRHFGYERHVDQSTGNTLALADISPSAPGNSVDFPTTVVGIEISRDGSWVSAKGAGDTIFMRIDDSPAESAGETNFANRRTPIDLASSTCLLVIGSGEQKREWLQDIRRQRLIRVTPREIQFPQTRAARETTVDFECQPPQGKSVSADGSLFASAVSKRVNLRSVDDGTLLSRAAGDLDIYSLDFTPDNEYLITLGARYVNYGKPTGRADINFWSIKPYLQKIASFHRVMAPLDEAISTDGKQLALAYATHIEIWQRNVGGASYTAPFALKSLIPLPPYSTTETLGSRIRTSQIGVSLAFSQDGKNLMYADGLLHIWNTSTGRLLARVYSEKAIVAAIFQDDEKILLANVKSTNWMDLIESVEMKTLDKKSLIEQFAALQVPDAISTAAVSTDMAAMQKNVETRKSGLQAEISNMAPASSNLLAGKTLTGENDAKVKFAYFHSAEGRLFGRVTRDLDTGTAMTVFEDEGSWEIDASGHYCQKWNKWRDQGWYCYGLGSLGEGEYLMLSESAAPEALFHLRSGDPENLGPNSPDIASDASPPRFDLTGVYSTQVTRLGSGDYYCFFGRRRFDLALEQQGTRISGKVVSGFEAEVEGSIVDDRVEFSLYTSRCSNIEGEWVVNADGFVMQGDRWGYIWKLQR